MQGVRSWFLGLGLAVILLSAAPYLRAVAPVLPPDQELGPVHAHLTATVWPAASAVRRQMG